MDVVILVNLCSLKKSWIRCTFWFNAGSRIVEIIKEEFFPAGGSNPVGPYSNTFPNPAGLS